MNHTATLQSPAPTANPSHGRRLLLDVILVAAAMVAVKQTLLPYTMVFAGPVSLLVAMGLATWRLHAGGDRWRDLGLRRPESLVRTGLGGVIVLGLIIASVAVGAPLATEVLGVERVADAGASRFGDLEGNLPLLLLWLILSWVHAGFNEEMMYRAFMLSRLRTGFAATARLGPRTASVFAVVAAAAFFGYRHMYYQGWYGFITTGVIGLTLGWTYLRFGRRNVWPLVIGHGLLDTLGMVLRYLGVDG